LDLKKICVSTGSACDSVNTQISHVIKAIGVPDVWIEHVIAAGYATVDALKEKKASQIQQNLSGYRKKNKLDIPSLSIDDVEKWLA
jgi:cysteine sulfinate desulfinase/cysteine desulfurase-like protein